MFQYLENLRKKPEKERRKAVFLISLYITLAIAIVWMIVTSIRVVHTDFSFDTKAVDKSMPSLGDTFNNFKERLGSIMDSVSSSTPQ
ncbi:MAG: hypothetical protein RLZZ67_182 [Candidatus Parcubacteria bacterium]|jgi:hypothetical protein